MKKFMVFTFAALAFACVRAEVSVVSVNAQQRYPWNGTVDIEVQLSGTQKELAECLVFFAATNVATKAELSTAHIKKVGEDIGSGTTWTRDFVWDAGADLGEVTIDEVELSAILMKEHDFGGVQLWENGPYFAECNVGASKPEEYGYYFWWGDTVGYVYNGSGWNAVDGSSTNFRFYNWSNENSVIATVWKDNDALQSEGWIDSSGNLTAAHDAATAHLGAPWRMPTDAEFAALLNNCDTTWTTRNGVYGRLITGRGAYASKSIFLPAPGYGYYSSLGEVGLFGDYWSSTPYLGCSYRAWCLGFGSDGIDRNYDNRRYDGQSVRPVRDHSDAGSESFATTHFAYQPANGSEMYIETIDGIVWRYSIVNKDAVIGNGDDVRAIDISTAGDISIPSMLGGCPVIKINDSAFEDCALLTSIKIPSSVMGIGDDAFSCCSSIVSLVIPASVVSIGEWAFDGCSALESITIPQSVTSIGEKAFAKCRNLTTVRVKKGDTERVKNLMRGKGVDVDQLTFVEAEVAEIVVNDVNGTITLPDGTTEENVSIKIMVAGHDIRPYINLPVAVGGVIDLSAAVVKPEVAAEAMDITKGAEITLSATNPTITTAPTKPGLTYTLVEGATIESMGAGASKLGDGTAWTPEIKVKGGASAFYSIKVTK